jgi:hypothetical protein
MACSSRRFGLIRRAKGAAHGQRWRQAIALLAGLVRWQYYLLKKKSKLLYSCW